jgi:hypothetical protein
MVKHHFRAGRSVYRQASVSESDHRTCGHPGLLWEGIPAEMGPNMAGYRLGKEAPSLDAIKMVFKAKKAGAVLIPTR